MNNRTYNQYVQGSFRDPCGRLFYSEGILYRQINDNYKEQYEHLMQSGLYESLVNQNILIPHKEIKQHENMPSHVYKIIEPEIIPFVSYPHEWCFSQLKHAALLTLNIQQQAMQYGMTLKDCSAYNIQFRQSDPVFIDTLSFEKYREGYPWVAYRQFCQHFLAPLALMSYKDIRLNQLFRIYMDGIPLDLASTLLPYRTKLDFSLNVHLHLHAKSQVHFSNKNIKISDHRVSRRSISALIDSLQSKINRISWHPHGTEWVDYYEDTNYSEEAIHHKKQIVSEFLDKVKPTNLWDLGANIGMYSWIASEKGIPTISFDMDSAAIERLYLRCSEYKDPHILPLVVDLNNPTPAFGWSLQERKSLIERGPGDVVLALALLHHLGIGNNVPFDHIAGFFSKICRTLIIEFIPKHDSQVKRLLVSREDIFKSYNQEEFLRQFGIYFTIHEYVKIKETDRTLFLMRNKQK